MVLYEGSIFSIFLRSKEGSQPNDTPNYVNFNLFNKQINCPDGLRMRLTVKQATFKITWYNVNVYNNTIIIGTNTYTIPSKNYNVYTLTTALNTLSMQTPTNTTITVTYDDTTGYYTFTSTASFSFSALSTANELLGFDTSSGAVLSTSNVIISTLVADLTYTSNIYITCPDLLNINKSSDGKALSDTLASVQVTSNSGGLIFYEGKSSTLLYSKLISSFNIVLKDDSGNLLPMNGGDWNIDFEIEMVNDYYAQDLETRNNILNLF